MILVGSVRPDKVVVHLAEPNRNRIRGAIMANCSDITEHMGLNRRKCLGCGTRLTRNPGEILCAWRRRKYCGKSCSARHCRTQEPAARFSRFVDTSVGQGPAGECHEWQGTRDVKGYGKFKSGGMTLAHRASWYFKHGSLPADMFVCHRCDNPACVRPEHLFLGTHEDNMDDMAKKGRAKAPRGAAHYNAKLSPEQVAKIISDTRVGRIIADEYGVSKGYVNHLKKTHPATCVKYARYQMRIVQ